MLTSIIKFGIKQTEAVTFGSVRFGLRVARTIVEAAIGATTGGRTEEASEPTPSAPQPRSAPTRPATTADRPQDGAPSTTADRPQDGAPSATADQPQGTPRSATADQPEDTPTSESPAPAASSPSQDPERERRIAMRDQPSDNGDQSPHHMLNNPVTDDPDPTEWPDPYDQREDPRDPDVDDIVLPGEVPHTPTGSQSTSAPHPSQDPEAER